MANIINTDITPVLLAGFQRCGTTALFSYLRQSPQLYTIYKEANRFGKLKNIESIDRLDFLEGVKSKWGIESGFILDGSGYARNKNIIKGALSLFPNTKVILIVRPQTERIMSLHYHRVHTKTWGDKYKGKTVDDTFLHLAKMSFFYKQCKSILDVIGRENLYILTNKDLRDKGESEIENISDFIGIDSFSFREPSAATQRTQNKYKGKIDDEFREKCLDVFQEDNDKLKELTGIDLNYQIVNS